MDRQEARNTIILQMSGIVKNFDGNIALKKVDFTLHRGEVHALMGENGAGKSTLMKILSGFYPADAGIIRLNDSIATYKTPQQALANGIAMIYQELNPVNDMTVAENIFLGREPVFRSLPFINSSEMIRQTSALFAEAEICIDPTSYLRDLSIAEKQQVEIMKAVASEANIIVMDEPTSSLSLRETKTLFSIIKKLQAKQVAIVYISHRMDEIFSIADRITVMRDGALIISDESHKFINDSLIKHMVGRPLGELFPSIESKSNHNVVLSAKGLSRRKDFQDISFELHKGEILGLAGLVGAGRTAVLETLFGLRKPNSGEIRINDKKVRLKNCREAIQHKIAFITEDRKEQGIHPEGSVNDNMTISSLNKLAQALGLIRLKKEGQLVSDMIGKLNIKTKDRHQQIALLSGGNQQKVILARWLLTDPSIIMLDEPTRGIDVGAKQEIYRLIRELASQGKSILLVSSDLLEIIGLCDRVLVMSTGKLTATLERPYISQENILKAAINYERP